MNQLIEYWPIIVALIVLLATAGGIVFAFFKSPSKTQLEKVKAWLLWAVTQAEAELGSGTGKLKLRYVYDLFITKFRWISYLISFESFSDLVNEALNEMRDMLATNKAINELVNDDNIRR